MRLKVEQLLRIMRTLYTGLALIIANATSAQLLNGSFEDDVNQPDLSYWATLCTVNSVADPAPFSGLWSAEIEASNPQGCFPAWLYQVVPWVSPGTPFYLGGWCRNVDGPWAPEIGIDIGVMSDIGTITPLYLGPTTSDTLWTWMSFDDTLQLGLEDQAVVLCNPGLVGGPAFALSHFDGIDFFTGATAVRENLLTLHHYYDAADGSLHIASDHGRIVGVRLLDPTGRRLQVRMTMGSSNTVHVDLGELPKGVYIATVQTGQGEQALRFVVDRP